MARIRSIHPGLFTDEAFMELTMEAPLAVPLLLGIWTEADDQGVFQAKALTLKARILPAIAADVAALLDTLEGLNFIRRFSHEGKEYGAIRNFGKFQRPKKPNKVHPLPESLRAYVHAAAPASEPDDDDDGEAPPSTEVNGDHSATTPEAVPHQFPTGGEKSPQMEEGGGRRKEGEEFSSLRSENSHTQPELIRGDSVSNPENSLLRANSQKSEDRPLALSPRPQTRRERELRGFDEFWRLYPRKVGKGQAERAWPQALKATGGDADEIVWGLKAQLHKFDRREDCRFVPHPSTWLNSKRWLDGLDPEEPAAPLLSPVQPRSH